jgi:hypothetical protein
MADLTVTAAQVSPIFPRFAEIYPFVAAETITAGQAVYLTTAGKVGVADANASGKQQSRGIALNGGGAGQAIDVLKKGHVAGFTVAQAYDAQLFLSDTAGALADAAGTMSVPIGRVIAMSDSSLTKVVYIEADWDLQRS